MTNAAILALAATCAPSVAPETMAAVVQAESAGDEWAMHINGSQRASPRASSATEAVSIARTLIAQGRSVDLGLAQVNSRNLTRLGLRIDDAFDPCRNLAAAGRILTAGYQRARANTSEQSALRAALSYYNTGNPSRGLANGYVARVVRASAAISAPRAASAAAMPTPASWDVFGRSASVNVFVKPTLSAGVRP